MRFAPKCIALLLSTALLLQATETRAWTEISAPASPALTSLFNQQTLINRLAAGYTGNHAAIVERVEAGILFNNAGHRPTAAPLFTIFSRWRRTIAIVALWAIMSGNPLLIRAQTLGNTMKDVINHGQVLATHPEAKEMYHLGNVPVAQANTIDGQINVVIDNSLAGAVEKTKQAQDIERWLAAASPLKVVSNHLDPHLTPRFDLGDGSFHISDAIDYNEFFNPTPTHKWEDAATSNTFWGKVWAFLARGGFKRVSQTTLDKSVQQVVVHGSKLLVDNARYREVEYKDIADAQDLWYLIAEKDVQLQQVVRDLRIHKKDLAHLKEAGTERDAQVDDTEAALVEGIAKLQDKQSLLQTERDALVSKISGFHFWNETKLAGYVFTPQLPRVPVTKALVQELVDLRLPGDTENRTPIVAPDDESLMAPVRSRLALNRPSRETLRNTQGISAYDDDFLAVLLNEIWHVPEAPEPIINPSPAVPGVPTVKALTAVPADDASLLAKTPAANRYEFEARQEEEVKKALLLDEKPTWEFEVLTNIGFPFPVRIGYNSQTPVDTTKIDYLIKAIEIRQNDEIPTLVKLEQHNAYYLIFGTQRAHLIGALRDARASAENIIDLRKRIDTLLRAELRHGQKSNASVYAFLTLAKQLSLKIYDLEAALVRAQEAQRMIWLRTPQGQAVIDRAIAAHDDAYAAELDLFTPHTAPAASDANATQTPGAAASVAPDALGTKPTNNQAPANPPKKKRNWKPAILKSIGILAALFVILPQATARTLTEPILSHPGIQAPYAGPIFQVLLWLAPLAVAIAAFAYPAVKNGLSEKNSFYYTYPLLAGSAFFGVFFFLPAFALPVGIVAAVTLAAGLMYLMPRWAFSEKSDTLTERFRAIQWLTHSPKTVRRAGLVSIVFMALAFSPFAFTTARSVAHYVGHAFSFSSSGTQLKTSAIIEQVAVRIGAAPGDEYIVDNDPLQDARNEKASRRQAARNAGVEPTPEDNDASDDIVISQGSLILSVEGPDDGALRAKIQRLNRDSQEAGAAAQISTDLTPAGHAFIRVRSKRMPGSVDDRLDQALVEADAVLPALRQEQAKDATRGGASIAEQSLRRQYAHLVQAANALIQERLWRNIPARVTFHLRPAQKLLAKGTSIKSRSSVTIGILNDTDLVSLPVNFPIQRWMAFSQMLHGPDTYMLVENLTTKKTAKITASDILGATENTGARGLLATIHTDPSEGAHALYRLLIEAWIPHNLLGQGSQPMRILGFYRETKPGHPVEITDEPSGDGEAPALLEIVPNTPQSIRFTGPPSLADQQNAYGNLIAENRDLEAAEAQKVRQFNENGVTRQLAANAGQAEAAAQERIPRIQAMLNAVQAAEQNYKTTGVALAPGQTWAITADGKQAWMADPARKLDPVEEKFPVTIEEDDKGKGDDVRRDPQRVFPLGEYVTLNVIGEVRNFEDVSLKGGDHLAITVRGTGTSIIVDQLLRIEPLEEEFGPTYFSAQVVVRLSALEHLYPQIQYHAAPVGIGFVNFKRIPGDTAQPTVKKPTPSGVTMPREKPRARAFEAMPQTVASAGFNLEPSEISGLMYLILGFGTGLLLIKVVRVIQQRRAALPIAALQMLNTAGDVHDVPLNQVAGYPIKAGRRSERERLVSDGTIVASRLLGEMDAVLRHRDRVALAGVARDVITSIQDENTLELIADHIHPPLNSQSTDHISKTAMIGEFERRLQSVPAVFVKTQVGEDFFGLARDEGTHQVLLVIDEEFWTRLRKEAPATQFMLLFRWLGHPAISAAAVGSLAAESISTQAKTDFIRDYHMLQTALDIAPNGNNSNHLDQLVEEMRLETVNHESTRLSGVSANGIDPLSNADGQKLLNFVRSKPLLHEVFRKGHRIPVSEILLDDFKHGQVGPGLSAYSAKLLSWSGRLEQGATKARDRLTYYRWAAGTGVVLLALFLAFPGSFQALADAYTIGQTTLALVQNIHVNGVPPGVFRIEYFMIVAALVFGILAAIGTGVPIFYSNTVAGIANRIFRIPKHIERFRPLSVSQDQPEGVNLPALLNLIQNPDVVLDESPYRELIERYASTVIQDMVKRTGRADFDRSSTRYVIAALYDYAHRPLHPKVSFFQRDILQLPTDDELIARLHKLGHTQTDKGWDQLLDDQRIALVKVAMIQNPVAAFWALFSHDLVGLADFDHMENSDLMKQILVAFVDRIRTLGSDPENKDKNELNSSYREYKRYTLMFTLIHYVLRVVEIGPGAIAAAREIKKHFDAVTPSDDYEERIAVVLLLAGNGLEFRDDAVRLIMEALALNKLDPRILGAILEGTNGKAEFMQLLTDFMMEADPSAKREKLAALLRRSTLKLATRNAITLLFVRRLMKDNPELGNELMEVLRPERQNPNAPYFFPTFYLREGEHGVDRFLQDENFLPTTTAPDLLHIHMHFSSLLEDMIELAPEGQPPLGNHDDISDAALALNRRQLPLDALKTAKAVSGSATLVNFTQGLHELMRSMFYLIPKRVEEAFGRRIRTVNYYQIQRELERDQEGQPARFIYASPERKNWNWLLRARVKNRFLTYVINPFLTDAGRVFNFASVMTEERRIFFNQPKATPAKKLKLEKLSGEIDATIPFLRSFNIAATTKSVFNEQEIAAITLPLRSNVLFTLRPSAERDPESPDPSPLPRWRPADSKGATRISSWRKSWHFYFSRRRQMVTTAA